MGVNGDRLTADGEIATTVSRSPTTIHFVGANGGTPS